MSPSKEAKHISLKRDAMSKDIANRLSKQWEKSQETLELAAKLEKQDMAIALKKYKAGYSKRRKEIILRELEDAYY